MSRAIRNLQDLLRARGYDPGPTDGIMGPRTDAALRAYQRDAGLPVDGRPGPETMTALCCDLLLPAIAAQPDAPDAVALIAQALHETGYGLGMIRDEEHNAPSWNWWNIKGAYEGRSATVLTWEVVGGRKVRVEAAFRAYPDMASAVSDYLRLVQSPRYAGAWAVRHAGLAYVEALRAAGYATDSDYTRKVAAVAARVARRIGPAAGVDWRARALEAEAELQRLREGLEALLEPRK